MEQQVKVRQVHDDGTATVIRIRESACSGDCHKCAGCGAQQQAMLFRAVNAIGAAPGDLVTVSSASGPVLAGAAVLYMMPLVLFFVGYFAGAAFGAGAVAGCVAFVLGIALAALYDRKVAAKKETVYTITGYSSGNTHTKGDNDLD